MKEPGIELPPADIRSKNMLLCFFDMEQRPSRNCITQLAKKAEQLEENGVTAIAIQTSNIDKNILNEWVKKSNIPFPVGMVKGNNEKIRFAWGVQSLPWLILTLDDNRHIVTNEGFRLGELNDKINAAK
ncbi:MAG: redoxin domain-containing protein [Sedimentisphaerales bacterium]|nr:redoxin domain-containing protein [Sedimentisphaerales bacterium]